MNFKNLIDCISKWIALIKATPAFQILAFLAQLNGIYKLIKERSPILKRLLLRMNNFLYEVANSILITCDTLIIKLKYSRLKITTSQLNERIANSDSWAMRGNALIEGSIIKTPIGIIRGKSIFQQFVRANNSFVDLGIAL